MATNLDPQLLEQILAMLQQQGTTNNGATQWTGQEGSPLEGYSVDRRRQLVGNGMGEDVPQGDWRTLIYGPQDGGTWDVQSNDVWDQSGNYAGQSSGDSTALGLAKAIAMSVGGYYGAGALNGAEGAAMGAGAEGAGGLSGWDAAMLDAGAGATNVGAAGGTLAGTAGTLTAEEVAKQAAAKTLTSQLVDGAKTAYDTVGGAKGVAGLLGAVAGAADSGDKEQTSSRDPWAPAQPYLRGLLSEGSDLYGKMKAEPFSQSQAAGYTNMGSLLDLVNRNAGGLLSGFQANASGANQFQRGRQGLLQGSSFSPTAEDWRPVGYGDMGMARYRGK